ncbi:MAG: hypothetical protein O7G31_01395 [Calditrichaeota bacterium]|nr:hypothetical protein [Calditrichota bacterium]
MLIIYDFFAANREVAVALAVAVKSELAVTASAIQLEKNRQKVNGANQADLAQNFERYTRPRILPGARASFQVCDF